MRKLFQSFLLELRSLASHKVIAAECVAVALITVAIPQFVRSAGDKVAANALYIQFILGMTFAMVLIVSLVAACNSFAGERAAHRFGLTRARPVAMASVWLGKFFALMAAAVVPLAFATAVIWTIGYRDCRHVMSPVMDPVAKVAEAQYRDRVEKGSLDEEMKKLSPRVAVARLMSEEDQRFESVEAGGSRKWDFDLPEASDEVYVRANFTTDFGLKLPVYGKFSLVDGGENVVSNFTGGVLEFPLEVKGAGRDGKLHLVFQSTGKQDLMLRPRHDIKVLVPSDSFLRNAIRADIVLMSILALVIALGLFLSSALTRPVAVFSAVVLLLTSLVAPAALEQPESALEGNVLNRIGLEVSQAVMKATRCAGSLHPIDQLADYERIQWGTVAWAVEINGVLLPLILLLLSAIILEYRPSED